MEFIGLDIGSQNIKLVQLKRIGEQYSIVALGLSPSPKNMESEAEADLLAQAEAIKKLVNVTKVSTPYVVSALPEDKVFTQIVEFPPMEEKEMESAIKWEAEQYIPIPLSEAVIDYQIIRSPQKIVIGGKTEVFLVAAPKSMIEKYSKVLQMAELKTIALETEMVALSRSLVLPGSGPTMIVDLGARATDISLVENNQIVLTRSLPSAGEAITRSLVAALGLKQTQAEEYKKAYGVDESKLEGKIREAVGPVLDIVIREINKVISFYQNKNKSAKVERVVLAGGTADLPQIVSLFAEKLGIEVEIGAPFERVQRGEEILAKLEKGTAPLYSVAFGLAMKTL
ncbi:MAG TPA: type IV pilus assembly protein PilM [Candidatus Bathyarchaeia archaeon]|nr:type IV pilus assembly protein PilM [Candidatus Bathyarchaeia archaeon]